MNTKKCLNCSKEYFKPYSCSKRDWKGRKYCSKSCANSANALGNQYRLGMTSPNKGKIGLRGKDNPQYKRIEKECKVCGKEFHKIYGLRNNTKKQIANFSIRNLITNSIRYGRNFRPTMDYAKSNSRYWCKL